MEGNKSSTKMNEDYDYKIKDMEKNYNEVLKKKQIRGKEIHSRKMQNTFYNGGEQEFH